jgi:hypothetical protein
MKQSAAKRVPDKGGERENRGLQDVDSPTSVEISDPTFV